MKKFLIFLLVFMSILALTSCLNKNNTLSNIGGTDNQINQNFSSGDTINVDYDGAIAKIKDEYKNNSNFKSCLRTNVDMCLYSVVNEKASQIKDESICDDLINKNMIDGCKTGVITSIAISSGSIEKCNELPDNNKDDCIGKVARSIALEKNDPSICRKYIIVKEANSGTLADGIDIMVPDINKFNLDLCLSEVTTKLAIEKKNKALCNSIENDGYKSNCIFMVENQINMEANIGTGTIQ